MFGERRFLEVAGEGLRLKIKIHESHPTRWERSGEGVHLKISNTKFIKSPSPALRERAYIFKNFFHHSPLTPPSSRKEGNLQAKVLSLLCGKYSLTKTPSLPSGKGGLGWNVVTS